MKEKNKRKEIIIIGVLILLMIGLIVGVSYAAFRYGGIGSTENSITSGAITMSYEETDNTISLTGALPTRDATGKVRLNPGEYFDFTVSSTITGNTNINYEISAKDVTTAERKIDGSNIKLYLTKLTETGEEELMVPETYNEETSENAYTGRPSGEMSLYTSSMNSSESNRYRLRMYVTEEYNPQGDGGNLSFSVKINVYGKDGEKYVPSAVDTLLAKVNAEDLDYNSATDNEKKEMWTFTHPATEQTEALTDYRYIGANPNNYVTFNNELWRIIGVFTVDDGTGATEERLKIIKDESIGDNITWNNNSINDWPNATLNSYLNSGEYWTNSMGEEAKEMIDNAVWHLGGMLDYIYGGTAFVNDVYSKERGTEVYSGRSTAWTGKIGLIYPSDYGYATSGNEKTNRNACLNRNIYTWVNDDCSNNDWLFSSKYQWTITPDLSAYNAFCVVEYGIIGAYGTANLYAVKPVTFLKSTVKIADGDGSGSNPYQLQL